MQEHVWDALLTLLAQPEKPVLVPCVGCWYEQQTSAFPASASSSLCPRHAAQTRARSQAQQAKRQADRQVQP